MADETTPDAPPTDPAEAPNAAGDAVTAVADPDAPIKLVQTVEIKDVGPCKKHIKVTVDRQQIDERFDEKFTELVRSDRPSVRGFRPGKAPRKMIERLYRETVADEVKSQVLMASLEQLADEQSISPLSPPDLDPGAIEIPEEGAFVYEFDIEVRPEFELPSYKGLKLRRPTHTFTPAEVEKEKRRLLEPYGQLVPKDGNPPAVELDDTVTANVEIKFGDRVLNTLQEVRFKVEPRLALSDGVAEDFGVKMAGAKPGDVRTVDITLSQELAAEALRGRKVQATFTVLEVKTTRPPELTPDLLEDQFGVSTPDAFDELVGAHLGRRLEYTQRQAARRQVLEQIGAASNWELPQDMLRRQARKTLARRVMEMKNAGLSDQQIAGRRRLLEQDVLRSTAAALKEHFVLQKVAEVEKLEIEDDDVDAEVERIADQSGESPRKVRARLEKEDLMEAVATDLLERKALDLILAGATYEDYELSPEQKSEQAGEVATVTAQAVPGEEGQPADPTAPPEPPADAPAGG
ncbi:MAG: trigger factor [Gemmataceae bacterium]|nr:trigger factor [Gemmataceae bacterium]